MADTDYTKKVIQTTLENVQPPAVAKTAYYDPNSTSGTGLVGDVFNTQSALYGGSAAAAEAARNATFDTAKAQSNAQTVGRQNVRQTLQANQRASQQLADQSGMTLQQAYRTLSGQQGGARDLAASEAAAIRGSGQVDTTGLNQQRSAIAGLDRMAANGPGPSGVNAAATQARQQTLSQALASLNAGRGAAASGANLSGAMGQAAAVGAQTAATAGATAAAENQAYQARRLQAMQAAGVGGASMQQAQQQITQQALAREQAAAGVMNAGDTLGLAYQQQMAAALAAQAGSQQQLGQLEALNAARDINSSTTYGQQQGADFLQALGYRQQQLGNEAQLRVQGIGGANSAIAGMKAVNDRAAMEKDQANRASRDAMIGTGMALGAALL